MKTVKIDALPTKAESFLYLYLNPNDEGSGETHAFLEDGRNLFEVGEVSSFGAEGVTIQTTQHVRSGEKQWEIYGALGAAADCLIIIRFDPRRNHWVSLLNEAANLTEQLDLDGDGEKEIVARFGASADLTIYRWRRDHYESVSIAKTLGSEFAEKVSINGRWHIRSGRIINGESQILHRFEYSDGKLIESGFR